MDTDALARRLRGTLVTALCPADAAESDGLIWNGRKPPRRARVIVRAAAPSDVQDAVRFAARNGLSVSARGGGHHFTGIASQADLVVDLAGLDRLQLDVERRSARVEPAVTNARMAAALDRHALAFPLGHCGSVAMSGYLLGGGVGWNACAWGFACFLVTAAEVVLADGRLVTASPTENAELFWALRGGGPDFPGIVTAYHLAPQPAAGAISTVVRVYPAAAAAAVADWAEAAMADAPRNVEFTAKVAPGPAGPVVAAIATVFAADAAEATHVQAQLARGAPEALEVVGPMTMRFPELYGATDPTVPFGRRYRTDCFWSDARLGPVLARAVAEMALAPSPESFAVISLRPNAVPIPEEAALSRDGRIFGTVYGIWADAADDAANAAWLHALMEALAPLCSGAYVGLADLGRPGRSLPTHSDAARRRLDGLRARLDPDGLFAARPGAPLLAAE